MNGESTRQEQLPAAEARSSEEALQIIARLRAAARKRKMTAVQATPLRPASGIEKAHPEYRQDDS